MLRILIILFLFTLSAPLHAAQCPQGKHWVAPHFRRAYVRYDGVHVKATHVDGHCRLNPRGYEQWHQRLSNSGPKVWGYPKEKTEKWTVEEIERVLESIAALPQQLLDLDGAKIHRMDKSVHLGNPATSNYDDVTLYDLAFEHKDSTAQILAHELSHVLYESLPREVKDDFANTAAWTRDEEAPDNFVPRSEKTFIEEDSRASVDEDFANHIEQYLFKNESLKNKSPESYKCIKKRFGDDFKLQRPK